MSPADEDLAVTAACALLTSRGFKVTGPAAQAASLLEPQLVAGMSFQTAMADAARHSHMEDQAIADAIGVSPGYLSRFMRHVGEQWARRLVLYMNTTNSRVPLQWIASRVDCDVIDRKAV